MKLSGTKKNALRAFTHAHAVRARDPGRADPGQQPRRGRSRPLRPKLAGHARGAQAAGRELHASQL